ncbi:MAG: bifunctional biotin--[acetyl-CoA-carboxylase] ligase/biotin operon repressor BirA [Pseudomonas sp.]|nr:bifunctional biotin--[acetyl-CoA-carboxylase] ligase/biotin operon repressor BirA [Pseudomonas sp.]
MQALLKLIQDGRFHSGQALGAVLGISRSAVWKQLQSLEAELGLVVHSVRGRGYCLERPLSLLDMERLGVSTGLGAWPVTLHYQLDSTNAEALRMLGVGGCGPFIVLAEQQSSGRGRRGRKWVSPFAENLYYSLAWPVAGGAPQLQGLSLVVGLAVLQALRAFGLVQAGLKWPNDVLVDGRKIAGVLLELVGDLADLCHVVIGIGVNVNMLSEADEITQPWTSLAIASGVAVDRNAFVRELSSQLGLYLHRHQQLGFSAFISEWNQADLWAGRSVTVTTTAQATHGVVCGVDGTGALILQTESGRQVFSGGEISLRLKDDT